MTRLVIFGVDGCGRDALRIARENYAEVVFASDSPSPPVLATPVLSPDGIGDDDELIVAIGDSAVRRRIIVRFPHLKLGSIIARTAVIGDDVEIGPGAMFCEYTVVTSCSKIGRDFQCNVYSGVGHDCVIGDHVTFGPRVMCNGAAIIGDGAHVAAAVIVRNGSLERSIRIGAGAFVGMAISVNKDVPAGARLVSHQGRIMQLRGARLVPHLSIVS